VTGTLVLVSVEWKGDDTTPTFSETRISVPGSDKLIPALTSKEDPPAVILVFVPPSMKYGHFVSLSRRCFSAKRSCMCL